MTETVKVGDPLPEYSYRNSAGEVCKLSEAHAEGPALILWLRHFG